MINERRRYEKIRCSITESVESLNRSKTQKCYEKRAGRIIYDTKYGIPIFYNECKMRTIAVVGSREGFTKEYVYKILDEWFDVNNNGYGHTDFKLVSGGAPGVDTYAHAWRKERWKWEDDTIVIRPINPANKMDYLFRNIEIITLADEIIAFHDGKSRGTKFTLDYAKARNKKIVIYTSEANRTLEEFK